MRGADHSSSCYKRHRRPAFTGWFSARHQWVLLKARARRVCGWVWVLPARRGIRVLLGWASEQRFDRGARADRDQEQRRLLEALLAVPKAERAAPYRSPLDYHVAMFERSAFTPV